MRFKGLHDIKTHGSLAREGRLISVAKNLHRSGSRESEDKNISDSWRVKRHIYPNKQSAGPRRASTASLPHELFLENKMRLYQIEVLHDLLQEMQQAIAEGIPVAAHELERLTKKLAQLV